MQIKNDQTAVLDAQRALLQAKASKIGAPLDADLAPRDVDRVTDRVTAPTDSAGVPTSLPEPRSKDVDQAVRLAGTARAEILAQAGTAVPAQANVREQAAQALLG